MAVVGRRPRTKVQLSAVSGTVIDVKIETAMCLDPPMSGPADVIVGITQDGLRVFAFVQNRAGRRILGASDVAIAPAAPSE